MFAFGLEDCVTIVLQVLYLYMEKSFAIILKKINRKFHVATEIGSTFFGCWSVTGQLKK
jgi:hypothetical protein